MKSPNIKLLQVNYLSIPMGRLAFKNRQCFFEYTAQFLETGLQLSPFKLPLQSGLIPCQERVFDGLFGVFNDSLPDGWGRLLQDRKLMNLGIDPSSLSPLDRLYYVGKQGMGALSYEPAIEPSHITSLPNLDQIAQECIEIQNDQGPEFIDELLVLNGSSAGARPKVVTPQWIIKFPSTTDPKDIGAIEYAYHLMAQAAKITVPEARLFPSRKHAGYFGVARFDRQDSTPIHMHTAAGLLHIDYRLPNLDYETLMRATLFLTRDLREAEKQLRATAFNVFAHNRDDHAKNFSFVMSETGLWQVSPAYDLTFSAGPQGEHASTIMGEGKNPGMLHLQKLAAISAIAPQTATAIIEEVRAAISKWSLFAKQADVSAQSTKRIQLAIN